MCIRDSTDTEVDLTAEQKLGNLLHQVTTDDLLKFGMIPEFVGRLPVVATLQPLGLDELMRVCMEPKNAIVRQFKKFFQIEGAELEIPDDVLRLLAKRALDLNTGARGIRSILESVMLDILFELPSRKDVKKFVLTEEIINGQSFPWPPDPTPAGEAAKRTVPVAARRKRGKARREAS